MENIIEIHGSKVIIGSYKEQLDALLPQGKRVVVVTDSTVDNLYPELTNRFEKIIIGEGEENKTLATASHIYQTLIEMQADREIFLLAVGGGIVTDITGFIASTFMRGVRFGFIATTLLSQVDASVGGKNGVNFGGFKNMVGTFNQPEFVICDTIFFTTLPPREVASGFAEAIKCGVIASIELFDIFANYNYSQIMSDKSLLEKVIYGSIRIKADIVLEDERESSVRRLLNFGHTFAHAVEKSTREFLHGEAVAIGMVMAADMSLAMGELAVGERDRLVEVIASYNLPTMCDISVLELIAAIRSDKKRSGDSLNFVFTDSLGSAYVKKVSFEEIEAQKDIFGNDKERAL